MPFRPTHPEYEPRPAFDNSHSTPGSTAREPARNRGSGRDCERRGSRHSHLSVIWLNHVTSGSRPPPPS